MYRIYVVDLEDEDVRVSYDADTLPQARDLGRYLANYWIGSEQEIVIEDLSTKTFLGSYQYKGEWEPEC